MHANITSVTPIIYKLDQSAQTTEIKTSKMQWVLRNAEEADIIDIMQIHEDCLYKSMRSHYTLSEMRQYNSMLNFEYYAGFLKTGQFVMVAREDNNQVIAFAYMEKSVEHNFTTDIDFEIHKLYVSPAVSGKGVGKTLYRELEQRALEDVTCCIIGVKSSLKAIFFYEACGFKLTGVDDSYEIGGAQLKCKHMINTCTFNSRIHGL